MVVGEASLPEISKSQLKFWRKIFENGVEGAVFENFPLNSEKFHLKLDG